MCLFFIFFHQASAKSLTIINPSLKESTENGFSQSTPYFQASPSIVAIENISSNFGPRQDPITGILKNHHGVDYRAKIGSPITAISSGTVLRAGYSNSLGNFIEIDHGFGITSKYGHASQLIVYIGQMIKKGQVIALAGNTGHSTGPHLHFEIAKDGFALNPLDYIYADLETINLNQPNKYSKIYHQSPNYNLFFDRKIIKPYYFSGEVIVAVRVRSGRSIK
jgi:hypothetical protein